MVNTVCMRRRIRDLWLRAMRDYSMRHVVYAIHCGSLNSFELIGEPRAIP